MKKDSLLLNKTKATGVHLLISGAIFAVFLYFILQCWYPYPYFNTDGGWRGVRLMIAVDIVLGPFLTFLIFDLRKTKLAITFDLSSIATVQLIALIWGGYTVYSQRPVVIVHLNESFQSVIAQPFINQGVELEQLSKLSDQHPPIVYLLPPRAKAEYQAQLERLKRGIGEAEQFAIYRPLKDYVKLAFDYRLDIDREIDESDKLKQELEDFLQKHGSNKQDFYYMPYYGRFSPSILVFDKKGTMVGALFSEFQMYRLGIN